MAHFLSKLESPAGIGLFFLFGIVTGFHCMSMCGPISSIILKSSKKKYAYYWMYHASRILSYSTLGWAVGFFDQAMTVSKWSKVWIGVWIVIMLALSLGKTSLLTKTLTWIQRHVHSRLTHVSLQTRSMVLGFFTPLFPCGPLYAALASGLLAPSPLESTLWMLFFALGTIPLLLLQQVGIASLSHHLPFSLQIYFYRWIAFGTAVFLFWKHFL
ncbi:MAG: sulfite exporter TauE/SafE family protein [Bdellovibrionales bacterium]|nr:sulfite exporter TauE/SafE family protein [Bdellovibrionales bacterium]